jgi:DNA-binding NarL/FixJ family response regulator
VELRTLRDFLSIADGGSLTTAAAVVYVAQLSLSRRLQGLERQLGVALFSRLASLEFAREAVARADANKQIAERLFLSPRPFGGHLHRLFPKLGITTRAALRHALASPIPT